MRGQAHGGRGIGLLAPVAVALIVAACFGPSLRAGFLWDDEVNLLENYAYRGLGTSSLWWMLTALHAGHYHPLTWLTLGVDHALWGMDPLGYHLTNVALHAANAALLAVLLAALLQHAGGPTRHPAALRAAAVVGALVFAVHPLRVESVAWVSERRDVLSGLFYLATLLAWVRRHEAEGRTARRRWSAIALGCFGASLLSKAWGITLPIVLLILDWYPLGRLRTGVASVLREKIPYALMAVAAAGLAFAAQARVEAMRSLAEHGLLERAAQAAWGLCFYVRKTIVPIDLSPLYLLPDEIDAAALPFALSGLTVVVAMVALVGLRRRWPAGLAACMAYAVIVSPVLGVAQTGPQIAADRYTYLACLPWAALFAGMVRALVGSPTLGRTARGATLLVAAIIPATLGVLTIRQSRHWTSAEALWEHALRLEPRHQVAYANRGWARHQAGDLAGAIADYTEAIGLRPDDWLSYSNRGFARQLGGDLAGAMADYTISIRLKPDHAEAHYNRGTARQTAGDLAGAVADYTEAIRLDPTDARYHNNRGKVRETTGDVAGARDDYRRALATAPAAWPGRVVIEQNLTRLGGG